MKRPPIFFDKNFHRRIIFSFLCPFQRNFVRKIVNLNIYFFPPMRYNVIVKGGQVPLPTGLCTTGDVRRILRTINLMITSRRNGFPVVLFYYLPQRIRLHPYPSVTDASFRRKRCHTFRPATLFCKKSSKIYKKVWKSEKKCAIISI